MKISVALLTFSLFYLSVAEVQQLDQQAGEGSSTKIANIEPASVCSGDTTGSQEIYCQLTATVKELEDRLKNTEKELEDLKKEVQALPSKWVAFGASSGIAGNDGPFNYEMTLIYKKVYSNTGIFTAPVKGVYYFSFSGHNSSSKPMELRLMTNGVQMVCVYNHAAGNRYEMATDGMTLELRYGDRVYMRLWSTTWSFDNDHNHSTFTGYLLFRL